MAALMVALSVMAGACSRTIDRDGTREILVQGGATPEQADCLVERLAEEFDGDDAAIDQLSDDDPGVDPEVDARLQAISVECGLTAQPPP